MQIAESLKDIQADLKTLLEHQGSGKTPAILPDNLIEKLQGLTLGPSEKPKEKREVAMSWDKTAKV